MHLEQKCSDNLLRFYNLPCAGIGQKQGGGPPPPPPLWLPRTNSLWGKVKFCKEPFLVCKPLVLRPPPPLSGTSLPQPNGWTSPPPSTRGDSLLKRWTGTYARKYQAACSLSLWNPSPFPHHPPMEVHHFEGFLNRRQRRRKKSDGAPLRPPCAPILTGKPRSM